MWNLSGLGIKSMPPEPISPALQADSYSVYHQESSLVGFNLFFISLINLYLSMFLLVFILPGALCFLDLADCFISHVKEVFSYYLFQYFLTYSLSFLLL